MNEVAHRISQIATDEVEDTLPFPVNQTARKRG
jgi:hypothetical protein